MQRIIYTFAFSLVIVIEGWAGVQSTFHQDQNRVFEWSYNQWMCSELRALNQKHFDCSNADPREARLIPSKKNELTGLLPRDIQRYNRFEELYFPDDDCTMFLTLKSLCDLYFPLIEKKLASHSLPKYYKYLPLVLTGFNPTYSEGTQRTGMWAMDYLAARTVHLQSDSLSDERRGGDFTTEAVVNYLEYLKTKFNGDPAQMLIAYRYGVGYTQQLIRKHELLWTLYLRSNELQFLQFYEYTVDLFENISIPNQLSNYFGILGQYENFFFTENVRYAALVDVLKLDEKKLRAQNPVYTGQWIGVDSRKVPFILNEQSAVQFRLLEDSIYHWKPKAPPVKVPDESQTVYHKVKRGETLGGIAAKYHVGLSQLKKLNKIKGSTIYPGQKLKVKEVLVKPKPTPEDQPKIESIEKDTTSNSENKTPKVENATSVKNEKVKAAPKPTKEKKGNEVTYTVKSGDSLWVIASKYKGVTAEEIMKWNNCSAKIRPGQKLKIYR